MDISAQRSNPASGGPQPQFLDTSRGPLFGIYHRPSTMARGNVLCVPPFNEEMNRCRSMLTLQAQALSALGFGTLVIDLHGTGDSAGEYRDARWPIWLDDIRCASAWLEQQPGGCSALWGIRLGAILAAQSLHGAACADKALILWQPIVDGKQYFTQFLRMRIAANMDRPHLPKETTASMRACLAAGDCVEIAGYEIHPELAAALDSARLSDVPPTPGTRTLWLEQAASQATELSPAGGQASAAWLAAKVSVDIRLFEGAAFWQVHQRVVAASAIDATATWAGECLSRR